MDSGNFRAAPHSSNQIISNDTENAHSVRSVRQTDIENIVKSHSSSTSSSSSDPHYSEDIRRNLPSLDLVSRQNSISSTKTCEVNLAEQERDSFSPDNSNNSSPSDIDCAASTTHLATIHNTNGVGMNVDNKIFEGASCSTTNSKPAKHKPCSNGILSLTSKEEKQRQNEEIVIMETSSISSETGSWESVFPHAINVNSMQQAASIGAASLPITEEMNLNTCCSDFLFNERNIQQGKPQKPKEKVKNTESEITDFHKVTLRREPDISPYLRERTYSSGAPVTADTSSLFAAGGSMTSLLRDLDKKDNALSTSGTSACFIDASSLRDEDEVLSFPSLDGHNSNDDHDAQIVRHSSDEARALQTSAISENDDESPTKTLETFHKSFAKCKVKSKEFMDDILNLDKDICSSSSSSEADSPQKMASATSASSTNNLSDEEKLWKREHDTQKVSTISDAQNTISSRQNQADGNNQHEDATEASVSIAPDLDSSDSSEIVKHRREQERSKQNPYGFQNQVQHFNIHPLGVIPKFIAHNVVSSSNSTLPNVAQTMHNDLSYTTDYSSSSPALSLVWSEHEHRPSYSNRHQGEDFDAPSQKPSILPETPHNSIVHIDNASSNNSSIHREYTLSSSLSHQRDSGAYCSDATDSPIPLPRTPKRSKFDEANPIVSGGASIKDFSVKPCESPLVKRRTDTCPIVSGGFVSLDFEPTRIIDDDDEVELRAKPKTRKAIPGIASWVVDMSDCRPERRKSTSSTSSVEVSSGKFRERSDSNSSHKSGCGFYVSLDDMDKKPEESNVKENKSNMSKSFTQPKTAGFFVNLSKSEYQPKDIETNGKKEEINPEESSEDKKAIFSMFIDFGDKKGNIKKEPFNLAQRLSSSLISQRRSDDSIKSTASSTETLMSKSSNMKAILADNAGGESKSLDYKCNIEAPLSVAALRRMSQQQRVQNDATKRHSWGTNQTKDAPSYDCKRSISLTANADNKNNGNGLMSIIDKLPIISKASSLSVDSSLSPYDEYMGSKSELSSCSNNSTSGGERDDDATRNVGVARIKKRRRDVQINETFDKSSLASITDGVLSKDISPGSTTDTDDLTFQQDEELAIREAAIQQQQHVAQIPSNRSSAIVMETIIEAKETSSPKKNAAGHTLETLHATIEKQKMLLETVNEHTEVDKTAAYVKLSDMDKPVKFELHSPEAVMSKSVGNHRQINRLFRDESKGRPHSWSMTRSTGNSFLNITNSVENLRSLSRLFPNFSKEFSNSLPNDMILDQMDYIQTDISGDSSLASSFSRSGMDESSISCRQPRRLGEDLLKMFLQEIATDMVVEVHGRRIKAHKCILRSRCQYFAAMLAGSGSQSVVSLHGYSYSAVHFALCHIYSGASHPPEGISLMELAALADLLGLEGLKEVTAHALKNNYCHNFHKPCSGCIDGILQVLPVALNHALDDLYRKCLRWTCRHYLKVWPTRQFAQLPPDILGRCRQQIVAYLTSETVLDAVLDCDNLLAQLAAYRWGGICENLVRDILEAAYTYIMDHFASLIASDSFLSLGHDRSCHIPRLEGVLLRTASSLTADQACRSYQRVTRLNTVLQAKVIQIPVNLGDLAKELQGLQEEDLDWDSEYIRLVSAILSAVEQCLIRQCSRAMRVTAWQRMDLDLRKKIQTLARLTEPLDMKRNSKSVSKAFTFSGSTRNQDLYQVKLAIQAHSKRALAQDTQLYKATQTLEAANVQTADRGVQANNDIREGTSKILKSNSRAHVPQSYQPRGISQSTTASERSTINTHRRTQSEAPVASAKIVSTATRSAEIKPNEASKPKVAPRLTDVRPRYLEPRKVHGSSATNGQGGPVRSATSSSIPAPKGGPKGHHLSSSDSSRNSSPAAARRINSASTKIGTKSINMSLDSLATPSQRRTGRASRGKSTDNERYTSDIGADSMAESMKSSVITNKTFSHESLSGAGKLTRSQPLQNAARSNTINNNHLNSNSRTTNTRATAQSANKLNGNTRPGAKAPRYLQQQHQQHIKSTGSSPSSVQTTKSAASRLSSVSSTNSSRDLYKQRSISVQGPEVVAKSTAQSSSTASYGSTGGTQRYSFLSAKSKEILAKRAEKNKIQQQQLQSTNNSSADEKYHYAASGPIRSASHSAVITSSNNRNILPSNIPTRRPNSLQLKKTNNGNTRASQESGFHNRNRVTAVTNGVLKAAHAVRQKIDLLIDTNTNTMSTPALKRDVLEAAAFAMDGATDSSSTAPMRIESKLERSSTFCKESNDLLDLNELQIIE